MTTNKLYAGLDVTAVVDFEKTIDGVIEAYNLSTATGITARLIGPDGPVSETVALNSAATGADWAAGKVVVQFAAADTLAWLNHLGRGNYFYFEISIGGTVDPRETEAVYEIKQAQSLTDEQVPDLEAGNAGYCTVEDVESILGIELTPDQTEIAAQTILEVEAMIRTETGRDWNTGPITGETHYHRSSNIFVTNAPVESVETVTARCGIGTDETTLVLGTDYEVRDLKAGHVWLLMPSNYDRITVSYTPAAMPADLKRAAAETAAAWMQSALNPGSFGLDSITLPDVSLKFSRSHVQQALPPMAKQVIENYRYAVHC